MKLSSAVLAALLATVSFPAFAVTVYPSCAVPAAPAHVWYIDPVNGSTPDAAHGGIAVGGVIGTADGSKAHPFNSLQAVFAGGKLASIAGYAYPLLSTAPWDHYGTTYRGINSLGAHGLRKDNDWAPANPDPTRINPGDQVLLETGNYGSVTVGYSGLETANVDASGNTDFVSIDADAGAAPVLGTLSFGGSRGFEVGGVTVSSLLGQGSANSNALVWISNGGGSKDIIIDGDTIEMYASWDALNADYAANGQSPAVLNNPTYQYRIGLGMSPQQAYYYIKERVGVSILGNGVNPALSSCVALTGSTIQFVGTAILAESTTNVLVQGNNLNHYGEDAIDFGNDPYSTFASNTLSDPINLADGNHPDSFQNETINGAPSPAAGLVIDSNRVYERTDPLNPWPNQSTFFQNTGVKLTGARFTNNVAEISNCPGLVLGGGTINSLVAGNTIVGNGVSPGPGCTAPQSGESQPSANNTWVNNVVAGRFYQVCGNGSTWSNNVQLPSRSGGVSTPDTLGYCTAAGTGAQTSAAGTYNGVTIIPTDGPTFAFQHYDPPATGLTSPSDPNLVPTVGGPLYQTGKPINAPNVGAM